MQMEQQQRQENEESSDEDQYDTHPEFNDLEYDIDGGQSSGEEQDQGMGDLDDDQAPVQDNEIMDIDQNFSFDDDNLEEEEQEEEQNEYDTVQIGNNLYQGTNHEPNQEEGNQNNNQNEGQDQGIDQLLDDDNE